MEANREIALRYAKALRAAQEHRKQRARMLAAGNAFAAMNGSQSVKPIDLEKVKKRFVGDGGVKSTSTSEMRYVRLDQQAHIEEVESGHYVIKLHREDVESVQTPIFCNPTASQHLGSVIIPKQKITHVAKERGDHRTGSTGPSSSKAIV